MTNHVPGVLQYDAVEDQNPFIAMTYAGIFMAAFMIIGVCTMLATNCRPEWLVLWSIIVFFGDLAYIAYLYEECMDYDQPKDWDKVVSHVATISYFNELAWDYYHEQKRAEEEYEAEQEYDMYEQYYL